MMSVYCLNCTNGFWSALWFLASPLVRPPRHPTPQVAQPIYMSTPYPPWRSESLSIRSTPHSIEMPSCGHKKSPRKKVGCSHWLNWNHSRQAYSPLIPSDSFAHSYFGLRVTRSLQIANWVKYLLAAMMGSIYCLRNGSDARWKQVTPSRRLRSRWSGYSSDIKVKTRPHIQMSLIFYPPHRSKKLLPNFAKPSLGVIGQPGSVSIAPTDKVDRK